MRLAAGVAVSMAAGVLFATVVPRYSLRELVESSEVIAEGRVAESWTAWDASHKYIWTHYRVKVTDALKGASADVVISEPGGTLEGIELKIADAVRYSPGEDIVVFARRMPNGYWRTTGYGQGKFTVRAGRVENRGVGLTLAKPPAFGQAARAEAVVQSLNGLPLEEFKRRVRALLP